MNIKKKNFIQVFLNLINVLFEIGKFQRNRSILSLAYLTSHSPIITHSLKTNNTKNFLRTSKVSLKDYTLNPEQIKQLHLSPGLWEYKNPFISGGHGDGIFDKKIYSSPVDKFFFFLIKA
jgi:hypothetical protein